MPSFQNKTFSSYFKRIFQINQAANTGVDATTRAVQTGDGVNTSLSVSDDVLKVQPQNEIPQEHFLLIIRVEVLFLQLIQGIAW